MFSDKLTKTMFSFPVTSSLTFLHFSQNPPENIDPSGHCVFL